MKEKKGFTLVELLVAVVVLGVVTGITFPVISGIQEQNNRKKYEAYTEGLLTSARLYVDAYQEDIILGGEDINTLV